jgi:hypothetical protein
MLFGAAVLTATLEARAQPPTSDPKIQDAHEEQQSSAEPGAESPARQQAEPASAPPTKSDEDDPTKLFTVGGHLETFYQYNFNRPGNGISNFRGYDDRHNTLAVQNAVIDVGFRATDLLARIALQVGRTPAAMYAEETSRPGTESTGETTPELWRHLQRATAGWQISKVVLLEAGIFPMSVGIESVPVRENWNWSRTHMSTRMPNYVTGARTTFSVSDRLDITASAVNGWNRVIDDNDEKTGIIQAVYRIEDHFTGSVSYVGGVEREGGAPEGRAWRHTADAWMQARLSSVVSLGVDGVYGFERTRFGLHSFYGAAGFGRVHLADPLWLALRVDRLFEDPAANARGASRAILIPARHVTSLTATLDYRPVKGLSIRLEGRHDLAEANMFFRGDVRGDGTAVPYVTNARTQTTALLGLVAWF